MSKTCFCEEKKVELPSTNEIEDATNKFGKKLKNYNVIIDSNDNLNLNEINEDYNNKITNSRESINEESKDIKYNIDKLSMSHIY